MKYSHKFSIALIFCAFFLFGMNINTASTAPKNECEKAISWCQNRLSQQKNVLYRLSLAYERNPNANLKKVIHIQINKMNLLRIECVDDINNACQ